MERYKPTLTAGVTNEFTNGWVPYMSRDHDGQWAKWDDVKILVAKLRGLETKISRIEDGCNCEEESYRIRMRGDIRNVTWMCPAHGYKRI